MFNDLYDYISLIFYWRWPKVDGVVTRVEIESTNGGRELRLAIVYEFSLGSDGPYTGESYWPWTESSPGFMNINDKIRLGDPVSVRYRRADPSVNMLDRSVWEGLSGL